MEMELENNLYTLRPLSTTSSLLSSQSKSSQYSSVFTASTDESLNSYSDTCFICFEKEHERNNSLPINLNECDFIYKHCNCNGLIHEACLCKWMTEQLVCPVCRGPVFIVKQKIIKDTSGKVMYTTLNRMILLHMLVRTSRCNAGYHFIMYVSNNDYLWFICLII